MAYPPFISRKSGLDLILAVLLLFAYAPEGRSAISGTCSNCHVMHDSETPSLLKEMIPASQQCLGCHGQNAVGDRNIITVENIRIPQVLHSMGGGDLAAGNFRYISDDLGGDYAMGHNVSGVAGAETPPMDTPPGFIGSVRIPGGTGPSSWPQGKRLECAGTWGCHGDRRMEDPMEAIAGAHHEDDSVLDGTTVGKSYRFILGLTGAEHPSWQYPATSGNHNGYRGDPMLQSMNTIGYLCGECHGVFHPHQDLGGTRALGANVWHRHPSERSFNEMKGGAYAGSEFEAYTAYDVNVPMAFAAPTGHETEVNAQSIITCITCHKAHGSPYRKILRWDYDQIEAGLEDGAPPSGCRICHSRK
jgi:predicted CXXCH cytochrome family protein